MYEKEVLANGLVVVGEEIPHVRSVACGILVGAGVNQETSHNNGISHFIEHMFFKGTKRRSALEIAKTLDELGGRLNAYTDKEATMFYSVVLDSHIFRAMDLLFDIFLNSTIKSKDINLEKKVVLEEIKMYQDTPDELIHDLFITSLWQGHSMGKPILGDKSIIKGLERKDLDAYIQDIYVPNNIVISLAGNFSFQDVIPEIRARFDSMRKQNATIVYEPPTSFPGIKIWKKDTEQVHICLGGNGFSYKDKSRYTLAVLNSILGGSMSSRLFQEIREKRGLAYSIYSYQSYYRNGGLFAIYSGTSLENSRQVVQLIMAELSKIRGGDISEAEIKKAKEHLKGNMVLSLESSNSRMSWNSKNFFYFDKFFTVEDVFSSINAVTLEDVTSIANTLFLPEKLCLTAIGPFTNEDHFSGIL
ncbi:MAG: insulinase family protein [Candidatus Margulisiibacteriota bacterium]|nr:MAG: hypothetical protein A2X43_04540 [Candidatus Margulisbacteria bacterium GWD2_39_127]OGI01588.1 MAG: hypothetical protein A2X42_08410 [Candidatus Margulisbacteria bacterium GWF2_38_17]OGI10030.1 MAG: hypothetical protein A2X41_09120 [Candidatus Margulisbacteria bacterium GWE2_39_32]PZM78285.1 MAG: insulinase family protein [Candidatus Margulisiibacteriota bacterium]HAR61827.1 peptidase M16 [Candidatus Margulisiibacteriota bacterium]